MTYYYNLFAFVSFDGDPDPEPKSPIETMDSATRQVILTIQRQIDFSS